MTTVHAYTGDQMILDGPHPRRFAPRPRRRRQHRAQQHRCRQRYRPGHPELNGKAHRLRPARACSHRLHHHSGGRRQGQGRNEGRSISAAMEGSFLRELRLQHRRRLVSSDVIGIPLRQPVRRHADDGHQARRRHLSGAGRVLVRQREQLTPSRWSAPSSIFAELAVTPCFSGLPLLKRGRGRFCSLYLQHLQLFHTKHTLPPKSGRNHG